VKAFQVLPDLGMAYASTLAISRQTSLASRLGSNLLGFQLVLSALTVGLCLSLGRLLYGAPKEHVVWIVVIVLSADLVLKTIKGTLRWLLKGLQHFGTEAASLLLERAALLVLGLLCLRKGYGVVGFALVFLIVRLPDTLGIWAWVDTFVVRLRPAMDRRLWKELLLKGIPFAYAGVMVSLLFQVDKVLLEKIQGTTETGFYGIPVQVLEGLAFVPRVLSYAFIPTMAALWARSPGEVTGLYRRGLKYLLLIGLPIAAFGIVASDSFIPFVFGERYGPSVPLSRLLIPVALFMFVSNFSETTLFCINRWRTLVLVSTLAFIVDVAMALALIPAHGAMGAAWARVAGEGSYALMTAGAVAVAGHRPGWLTLVVRPLACALPFALALHGLLAHGLLLASGVASLVWVVATFVFGVWDLTEWDLAARLLKRLRRG
jgi:O-antigen/teichoic acid export membrane protein